MTRRAVKPTRRRGGGYREVLERLATTLSAARDETAMLAALARFAVPRVADLCLMDVAGDDGAVVRVGGVLPEWTMALTPALRRGEPLLVPAITPGALATIAPEPAAQAAIRAAGIRSLVILPLIGRGRVLGLVTLAATAPGRRFTAAQLPLLQDIAHRAALGVDNARLYEQARQASRARDDTLAVVSHDLRNGLNTVLTAVALLLRSLPPDSGGRRDRKHVAAIRRSADRMNRLINDLLDVASIEAGRLHVAPRREAVRPLVRDAVDAAQALAAEKSLRFDCGAPGGIAVVCDRERVLQVLGHLIGNAVKFTPEGGSVSVTAEPNGAEVTFAVRDSGIGVSREQLPHVFDRFWMATPKARLGSGLGLTIAKGVVEALGGRIWAETAEGGGTVFFFTLPLDRDGVQAQ